MPKKKRAKKKTSVKKKLEKSLFEKEKKRKPETITDNDRLKAMFCYVPILGWIIALFIYLIEREDHFVQFHAVQGILLAIFIFIFSLLPYIESVSSIIGVAVSILMMVMAYNRKYFELPLLGDIAKRFM